MDSEILVKIIETVITIAVIVVTRYLIPLIKNKVGSDKYDRVVQEVGILVRAAEQLYKDYNGEQKLEFVTEKITEFLNKYHVDLNGEQVRLLIEYAVKEMKMTEAQQ